MNCEKCQLPLIKENELECSTCKVGSHYYCQGINETVFSKMSNYTKSRWVCTSCKIDSENKEGIQINNTKNNYFQQLADSIQYIDDEFDQLDIIIEKIQNEIKEIKEHNVKLSETNLKLSSDIQQLKTKINDLEWKSLENSVEIIGVPIRENEDCKSIVEEMTRKLNIECNVIKAFRIASKKKTNMKIIAWFSDKNDRNRFVIEAKKNKWNANQYQSDWPTSKIYINNNFTKFQRKLFKKSRSMAKEKNYKYVWVNGTDILVRKDENSSVLRITDVDDLKKIL